MLQYFYLILVWQIFFINNFNLSSSQQIFNSTLKLLSKLITNKCFVYIVEK